MAIFVAFCWCRCKGINPLTSFPWELKYTLFFRCLAGQLGFAFINLSVMFAPISLQMVTNSTSSFWISVIAFFLHGEPIYQLEIISMAICFAMVVVITIQAKPADENNTTPEENGEKD